MMVFLLMNEKKAVSNVCYILPEQARNEMIMTFNTAFSIIKVLLFLFRISNYLLVFFSEVLLVASFA